MIDILNIKPTVINKDLKGKYIAIYGPEKCGKTTFAAQQNKVLLAAFEIGYNFLPGIKAQPIEKWSDFKLLVRQLAKQEAKEMYDSIAIDTVAEAYNLCEQYICNNHGVTQIGDIAWGGGYAALKKEFESTLRKITMLGYGIIFISHSQVKTIKVDEDTVIDKISPALPPRAADIVNRMADVIGYIDISWTPDGESKRTLLTRQTPNILAGSRLKYLAPRISFGYNELVDAISEAIDKEVAHGAAAQDVNIKNSPIEQIEELDFDIIRQEASEIWSKLINKNPKYADEIMEIVQNIFGYKMKLSEIKPNQVDSFNLVLLEMKELEKNIL